MATKTVLSNVDLVRKFVFDNQPVTTDQVVSALREQMASISSDEVAREKYVIPVLRSQPYYRESGGKWEIDRDKMPEFQVLEEVMDDERRLLYDREVRSKVAKRLGMKVMTVVLDLSQAPGIVPFGSRWGLKQWVVANDQAAEVLAQHPNGLTEKDLLKHVCERFSLKPGTTILDLKRDKQKRFVADRKLWLLKENYEKSKSAAPESTMALPQLKGKDVDFLLEGSFLEAQTLKASDDSPRAQRESKTRLRKTLKKEALDVIEHRDDLGHKAEDQAQRLSQVLNAAGVDEFDGASYQHVESASKDKGLAPKEREEIQQFIDQLLSQETAGVGPSLQSVINAPLSARKMLDVLRLKYIGYSRDRAVIPPEYYRLMVETLRPKIDSSVLNPSCFDGSLAVEIFTYLFDRLEGAAWALADDGQTIELVQPDGSRYSLSTKDESLIEKARDKFIVTQMDLLEHFVNFKYTGIEPDKVLARSARIISRLSGFEGTYIVSKNFLTELPEVFSLPGNEDNDIPIRFDYVVGNLTFTQDANLAANYLDQALRLLETGGSCGVFVMHELLVLLQEHRLLGEFLKEMAVTHFISLPVIDGRHKVVLMVIQSLPTADAQADIISAEVRDFKSAKALSVALQKSSSADSDSETVYELVPQNALGKLIGQ